MAQQFIPEVKKGDTRVLTLGDKILPYSIKKLPGKNDFKFNTHNDSFLVKSELSTKELEFFTPIAKKLNSMGIVMAGLDVINNKVIEINVTSPCYFIKEINNLYNIRLEKQLSDYLLTKSLLTL
jgi:glutathione synthase